MSAQKRIHGLRWLRVAAAAAAVLIACPVAYSAFAYWLTSPQEGPVCGLDLGRDWDVHSRDEAIPNCQPGSLQLELSSLRINANDRYGLWYKVTLTNESSFDLTQMLAGDFIDTPEFTVWEAGGVVVKPIPSRWFGDISPYDVDREAWDSMRTDPGLKLFRPDSVWTDVPTFWTMNLPAGRTVASLPWVLPSRFRGKGLAEPPRGFSAVDGYVFRKSGHYRIQARVENEFHQVLVYPRADWCRRHLPEIAQSILGRLKLIPYGKSLHRTENSDVMYELRAQSNIVDFEVGG